MSKQIFTDEEIDQLYKTENFSISDAETIRKISLFMTRNRGHHALADKINPMFQYAGLYPEVMQSFDILPEKTWHDRKRVCKTT